MRGVYLKKGNTKVTVVPYYRIGDLFLTTNAANPSSFLGGTWQLFGPGKTLVCVDTSDNDFKTVKKTGGAKTVTLTIDQMPNHNHNITKRTAPQVDFNLGYDVMHYSGNLYGAQYTINFETANVGGGKAHNNLQPYITCYIWIRTA